VAELIDPHTGQWDEELVKQTFWEMDATVILSTPIRPEFEDYPAWFSDSRGVFTVKSAYKVYVKQRDAGLDTSSGGGEEKSFWKQLWDLPCLPKVKQFIWRLTHNSLPLRTKLAHRGIRCDTLCVCCKRVDEDGAHVFLKCKETREAWRVLGMEVLCDRMAVYEHAGAVVEEILKADDHQKILACCLLWRCWIRRNKINAGEKAPTIAEVISQTRYWAKESELLLSQGRTADVQKVEKKW
jgi:hypothetical protein